jgi:hypothetical protein
MAYDPKYKLLETVSVPKFPLLSPPSLLSPSCCCTCSAYIRKLFSVALTIFPTPPFRFPLFSAFSTSLILILPLTPVDSTLSPSSPPPLTLLDCWY